MLSGVDGVEELLTMSGEGDAAGLSVMRSWSWSSSCLFRRARRPASELTVSSSRAPIMTPMARSLSGTVGLVMSGGWRS